METYKIIEFNVPEPYRFGNRLDTTKSDLQEVRNDVKISSKFNQFVKDKSVIVIGPSPYLKGLGRGKIIDEYDIVVRLNKGWNVSEELQKDYGKKTTIRYHCMMEHESNGGKYEIENMQSKGVKWLASQFPYNLDYFHNDNKKFRDLNKDRINFHVPADILYHLNLHEMMQTRANVATSAVFDLINYDIKNLHLSGISFYRDGWVGDYKSGAENVDKDGKYSMDMKDMQKEGHAQEAQMHLINLLLQSETKFTVDKEIQKILESV